MDNYNQSYNWETLLCHYTSFEAALRIIGSNSLRFGDFRNMNDVAEVKREELSMYPEEFEREVKQYKSISLTFSSDTKMAFDIAPLWGHYAHNGNGVCLMFDKESLMKQYNKQYPEMCLPSQLEIKYIEDFTNAVFPEADYDGNRPLNQKEIENIFYTKAKDWEYENEYRLLVRDDKCDGEDYFLNFGDALMGAIVCFPKVENLESNTDYKLLRKVLPKEKQILRYDTSLGNRELRDELGNLLWPILGKDWVVDEVAIEEQAKHN